MGYDLVPSANPRTFLVSSNNQILNFLKRYNGIKFTHDPKSAKVSKGSKSHSLQAFTELKGLEELWGSSIGFKRFWGFNAPQKDDEIPPIEVIIATLESELNYKPYLTGEKSMDQDDDDEKEIKHRLHPKYANVKKPKSHVQTRFYFISFGQRVTGVELWRGGFPNRDDVLPGCTSCLENEIMEGVCSFVYRGTNIVVVVAINGGLITPILQDSDKLDLYLLSEKWKELMEKARKQLQPHEYNSEYSAERISDPAVTRRSMNRA
ncbi:dihydrolipoyllysine-residue acetyltransferase component 4 of pyruvate dehydrogenase complex, chloroplastic-like protein [Tanacetum coccineum]